MLMKKLVSAAPVGLKCGTHEGLPGFIFLGFIFYRGFIYLLRIYWELLAVSVFQRTLILTLAPALVLTLTKLSPPGSCWLLLEQSSVGEMISFIDFRV
jgi:hypothetical protein